jgi:hypothetical protein
MQAIVDSFQVGATYPCWYDPDRPDRAVLVRGQMWGAYVFLILPLGFLAVGGIGMLIAWKLSSSQAVRPAPVDSPTAAPAPAAPGLLPGVQFRERRREAFDPSSLGDPVASKTDWGPAKSSAWNFQIQKLVEVDPDRLEFRAAAIGLFFALFSILVGAGIVVEFVPWLSFRVISLDVFIALTFALGFAGLGIYLFRFFTTPIVLDRGNGFFWKGRKAPDEVSDLDSLPEVARLEEVHALQGIKCKKLIGSGMATVYELNLVLNDGTRHHLCAYLSRRQFERDASTLARFLGRPFWDGAV